MSDDNNVNASIAHLILAAVSGHGIGKLHFKSFSIPGLHGNYFLHGFIGFLHYQSGLFNTEFAKPFITSFQATRYLALPCLMADLYSSQKPISFVHLASGLIPFAMCLAGTEDTPLGNMVIAVNILSLCYYSMKNDKEWGWYTAGASIFAYFMTPQMGPKVMYPLGLALVEYCAYRISSAPVVVAPVEPPRRR